MKKLCLKCNNLTVPGSNYCKDHQRPQKKTQAEKSYRKLKREVYGTKQWKNLREKVMLRDLYTCQFCGAKAEEVHHIIGLVENMEKAFEIDNLMSVCRDCHFAIHAKKEND